MDYIGALGKDTIHEVFRSMHPNCRLTKLCDPGHTQAVEFDDGKIMFGSLAMTDLDWDLLKKETTEEHRQSFFAECDLIGMVNWTQTPHMSEIWKTLLEDYLPSQKKNDTLPFLFVDLADPEKRSQKDVLEMLGQLKDFAKYYRVVLGLNEKESFEIAKNCGWNPQGERRQKIEELSRKISTTYQLFGCVIHPVEFAICTLDDSTSFQEGPFTPNPVITTGAGDHFNAGFCLGLVLGFKPEDCLLAGVANSGFYVRNAKSADAQELARFIDDWKR